MQQQTIGFLALGAYCFFASVLGAAFARLHLTLSFLNFPIFIGEGLMLFCLGIACWSVYIEQNRLSNQQRLFLAYLGFIALWAGYDYCKSGGSPLALRNGELFFYPVFAFFAYIFYRPSFFSQKTVQVLLALLLIVSCMVGGVPGFFFIYFILFFAVLFAMFSAPWKYLFSSVALLLWPYSLFFSGARTWLVSSVLSGLFLIFLFLRYFINLNKMGKFLSGVVAVAVLLGMAFHFADKNGLRTLTTPVQIVRDYRRVENLIRQESPSFHPQILQVYSYNHYHVQGGLEVLFKKNFKKEYTAKNEKVISRNLQTAYNDILFRLLIWQDMLQELWENKSVFGVGLSHPQRSKSIEILNWASSEWENVGWITPHNSFLDMIYRAGLIGGSVIFVIFRILFELIRDFVGARSVTGVLLSGIIVYGLISANFLLILELPYYAIPFWCIFGVTMAYRRQLLLVEKIRPKRIVDSQRHMGL
ncbi:MAG: O-antigen ligase family protein [Candidatus Omnitrophica bacterium]|nr:O-antigen ligase family protein [Candidatus Omnitrophota bacterium]